MKWKEPTKSFKTLWSPWFIQKNVNVIKVKSNGSPHETNHPAPVVQHPLLIKPVNPSPVFVHESRLRLRKDQTKLKPTQVLSKQCGKILFYILCKVNNNV